MSSKLRFYIGIILIVNILFFGVQYYFNYKYVSKLQKIGDEYSSIQQKEILIFELKDNVSTLENQIFSNVIFSINDTLIKCRNKKIEETFSNINSILNILKNGGDINENIKVNGVQYVKIDKKFYIEKEKNDLYLKDIQATLDILPSFIKRLNREVLQRNHKLDKKIVNKLRYSLKLIPSIINRTKENINNYLLLTENMLKNLEDEKKKILDEFFYLHLILFLILIILNFVIFYLVIIDVQKINEELKKRLYYDRLTGLKNRIKLKEEIKKGTLFIVDIEKFGIYNELYGNKMGDEILKKVADLLLLDRNINEDNLYRIGSDEFAIFFQNDIDIVSKVEDLERILKENSFNIGAIKIENLSVKFGISTIENLLDNAFVSLKIAKKLNSKYHIFTEEDLKQEQEKIKEGLFWTQKIQKAIDNDLITPVFQSIVDKNGNLYKYETLLRIKDGEKLIPPFFLPIAIQNNQYFDISKIMFSKAIEYINNQRLQLSFNINYLDLENDEMYEFYKKKLIEDCMFPQLLTFEILESVNIKSYDILNKRLKIFKALGVKLAIDDFGSGYSNYKHILKLNPDFLKIDGSLIKDILTDKQSLYIVESIQHFANKIGILTVAEFVENEEIFKKLKEIGINYYQGYYFSKPKLL